MIVYKYKTEKEAIDAIKKVNDNYLFSGKTANFVDYTTYENYFIIIYFEELRQYLGEPIEIQIQ